MGRRPRRRRPDRGVAGPNRRDSACFGPSQWANLVWALLWDGGLYGIVDALLLSVLPVLLVYGARPVDELRNPAARWGWGLSALLASMFPIAPILSHVVMHIAAVLHGMATTVQLPPH